MIGQVDPRFTFRVASERGRHFGPEAGTAIEGTVRTCYHRGRVPCSFVKPTAPKYSVSHRTCNLSKRHSPTAYALHRPIRSWMGIPGCLGESANRLFKRKHQAPCDDPVFSGGEKPRGNRPWAGILIGLDGARATLLLAFSPATPSDPPEVTYYNSDLISRTCCDNQRYDPRSNQVAASRRGHYMA